MYERSKRHYSSNTGLKIAFTFCKENCENMGLRQQGHATQVASINLSGPRRWTSAASEVLIERRG